MWFQTLFGFHEREYRQTQASFSLVEKTVTSKANGRSWQAGSFTTPTLTTVRESGRSLLTDRSYGPILVEHIAVDDALQLHAVCPGALFQVASQLNCLEFPTASTTPEQGVTGYAEDMTQGPACSLACAASTVVRNYLVNVAHYALAGPRTTPAADEEEEAGAVHEEGKRQYLASVEGRLGQHADSQINNVDLLERALPGGPYWRVRNGYTLSTPSALAGLPTAMEQAMAGVPGGRDQLMGCIKLGLHRDAEVTFSSRYVEPATPVIVSQAFCSAASIAYAQGTTVQQWEPLARLLLDAHYEGTLWAAVLNAERTGVRDVYLTFVGGGVFGNPAEWIAGAMGRAVAVLEREAQERRARQVTAPHVGTEAGPGSRTSSDAPLLRVRVCHFRTVHEGRASEIDAAVKAERGKRG